MNTTGYNAHLNATTTPAQTDYVNDLAGIFYKVFIAIGVVIAITLAFVCIRRYRCQKRKSDKDKTKSEDESTPESPAQNIKDETSPPPSPTQESSVQTSHPSSPTEDQNLQPPNGHVYFDPKSTINTNHYDKIDESAIDLTDIPIASTSASSSYLHPITRNNKGRGAPKPLQILGTSKV